SAADMVSRTLPVSWFLTTTVTPGSTAPCGSVMRPRSSVVPCCAAALAAASSAASIQLSSLTFISCLHHELRDAKMITPTVWVNDDVGHAAHHEFRKGEASLQISGSAELGPLKNGPNSQHRSIHAPVVLGLSKQGAAVTSSSEGWSGRLPVVRSGQPSQGCWTIRREGAFNFHQGREKR